MVMDLKGRANPLLWAIFKLELLAAFRRQQMKSYDLLLAPSSARRPDAGPYPCIVTGAREPIELLLV